MVLAAQRAPSALVMVGASVLVELSGQSRRMGSSVLSHLLSCTVVSPAERMLEGRIGPRGCFLLFGRAPRRHRASPLEALQYLPEVEKRPATLCRQFRRCQLSVLGCPSKALRKELRMRTSSLLTPVLMLAMCCGATGQTAPKMPAQTTTAQDTVRVFAQGDSSRLPDFVESCKREFSEHGMKLQLVRLDEGYNFNIIVAQESSVSGAAAAVVVLDPKGMFVASVVRSGRWSGKGAFNASAKELAKKLAVLRNQ